VRVTEPGNVVHELSRIDLADLAAVTIENETSGREARATRVFPDGSFDGYVLLVPGENVVRVTATGRQGGRRAEVRRVFFEKRPFRSAEEEQAWEGRLERLRSRTRETELLEEMERARPREGETNPRRGLEIDLEPGDPNGFGDGQDPSSRRR
jgi:hypothetical protein